MTNFSAHQNSHISKSTSSINRTHTYIFSSYSSYTIHPSIPAKKTPNPQTHPNPRPRHHVTFHREFPFPSPSLFQKRPHTPTHDIQKLVTQRVQYEVHQRYQHLSIPCKAFGGIAVGFRLAGVGIERLFSAGCRWKRERGDG